MTVTRGVAGRGALSALRQTLMVIVINIPAVSFGLSLGWVSLVSGEAGDGGGEGRVVLAAAGTFLAGLLGVPLSARALSHGRKTALLLTSLAFLVCWSLKLAAGGGACGGGGWCVLGARLAAGLGGAAAWCVSPLMAKEMCSARWRGAAVSALVLAHNLGLLLMYLAADIKMNYTSVLWWCLGVSLVHSAVSLLIPESPPHLAARGKLTEARASLGWLRGVSAEDPALDEELDTLPPLDDPLQSTFTLVRDLVSDAARRKAFAISLVCVVGQESCGVLALLQFAERVFVLAREDLEPPGGSGGEQLLAAPSRYALWLGVTQLAASAAALYLVERIGRRPLLVWSACAVAACLAACGAWVWSGAGWGGAVPGVALAAAVAADSVGLQPVPYAVLTEMFHYQYRGCVHMLVMACSCVGNAAEVLLFPGVVAAGGAGRGGVAAALALSALITTLYALFALVCVPETRGRTVDQIYEELSPRRRRRDVTKCAPAAAVTSHADRANTRTNSEVYNSKETFVTSL